MYQKLDQSFTVLYQGTSLYHIRLKCFDVLKQSISAYELLQQTCTNFLTAMVISQRHNQPAVHFWCLVFLPKEVIIAYS